MKPTDRRDEQDDRSCFCKSYQQVPHVHTISSKQYDAKSDHTAITVSPQENGVERGREAVVLTTHQRVKRLVYAICFSLLKKYTKVAYTFCRGPRLTILALSIEFKLLDERRAEKTGCPSLRGDGHVTSRHVTSQAVTAKRQRFFSQSIVKTIPTE